MPVQPKPGLKPHTVRCALCCWETGTRAGSWSSHHPCEGEEQTQQDLSGLTMLLVSWCMRAVTPRERSRPFAVPLAATWCLAKATVTHRCGWQGLLSGRRQ